MKIPLIPRSIAVWVQMWARAGDRVGMYVGIYYMIAVLQLLFIVFTAG